MTDLTSHRPEIPFERVPTALAYQEQAMLPER
jgi:hypothetical protein